MTDEPGYTPCPINDADTRKPAQWLKVSVREPAVDPWTPMGPNYTGELLWPVAKRQVRKDGRWEIGLCYQTPRPTKEQIVGRAAFEKYE